MNNYSKKFVIKLHNNCVAYIFPLCINSKLLIILAMYLLKLSIQKQLFLVSKLLFDWNFVFKAKKYRETTNLNTTKKSSLIRSFFLLLLGLR